MTKIQKNKSNRKRHHPHSQISLTPTNPPKWRVELCCGDMLGGGLEMVAVNSGDLKGLAGDLERLVGEFVIPKALNSMKKTEGDIETAKECSRKTPQTENPQTVTSHETPTPHHHHSATRIQSITRGHLTRKKYFLEIHAARRKVGFFLFENSKL